ncbi:response regulator [Aliterella atlantica]|uniref:histidine kinase n=1 Tax=Aliterella atlantica CENA595 TaxID=1618023 RepID=A0A0D8ZX37_9CYAN|nr:response regulator [Aliterella atlantica]KJH73328.1 hypothetical protein UH38_00585 [Aliterella atlantica CENA595]
MPHPNEPDRNLEQPGNTGDDLAAQIAHLRAELWLEQGINQIQSHLNSWLSSHLTAQTPALELEAVYFYTFIKQLNLVLQTDSVALAFSDMEVRNSALLSDAANWKICYEVAAQNLQLSEKCDRALAVVLPSGKPLELRLGAEIATADLQYLQQQPQRAWQLHNTGGLNCWLIVVPVIGDLNGISQEYKQQLIERSLLVLLLGVRTIGQLKALALYAQQLATRNRELVKLNQQKNEFLLDTTKAIHAPLNSLVSFINVLQSHGYATNAHQQEYFDIIASNSQKLLALVDGIADLAEIEANQLTLNLTAINVADTCREAISLVQAKAQQKNLNLRLEIDALATILVTDKLRLKQMLVNLLLNALKLTNRGSVGLQVKHQGVFVHFTVWDTGVGMNQAEQAILFQPHNQIALNAQTNENPSLGLAIAQKLAALHAGWIEVRSEVNRGSRLTLVLPLTPAAGANQGAGSAASFAAIESKATILLVEDNIHNAKLVTTYLRKLGYQVNLVSNAAQMWQSLERSKPQLILMDIHLPDVDGLTLMQQLRDRPQYSQMPIIAQTAMANPGDRVTCLAAGATEYISKPIDLKLLADLVAKYSAETIKK